MLAQSPLKFFRFASLILLSHFVLTLVFTHILLFLLVSLFSLSSPLHNALILLFFFSYRDRWNIKALLSKWFLISCFPYFNLIKFRRLSSYLFFPISGMPLDLSNIGLLCLWISRNLCLDRADCVSVSLIVIRSFIQFLNAVKSYCLLKSYAIICSALYHVFLNHLQFYISAV